MKKTKKLASALIGALTLSMTLGGFVAPPAMAEPSQEFVDSLPRVI
ncbi:MAG: hypothetical protein HUJ75_05750, partial [Parasporobacterium sp.]|nr:hypothetical protein [Parasporobacterium sp.]